MLRSKNYCLNCLRPGHFVRKCKSLNHCRRCQRPHHTLLHQEKEDAIESNTPATTTDTSESTMMHVSIGSNILLMTCQVKVETSQGIVKARALLDTGSSASFVTERLAQSLHLRRFTQNARICGIAGIPHSDGKQAVTQFLISSVHSPGSRYNVNAFIVPQITGNQPACVISPIQDWKHLEGLTLADPEYDKPGGIDILLGVGIFIEVIRHGRRSGPPNSPAALNTAFGWVLAGSTGTQSDAPSVSTHFTSVVTGDDLLRRFWEFEEKTVANCTLTIEERCALEHFNSHHSRNEEGRFVIPLPKRPIETKLGESRSLSVRRFLSFERSIHARGIFPEVQKVVQEYFDQQHAEEVPPEDLEKHQDQVFYLPIHIVCKESSTTTKIRAVFDASVPTSISTPLSWLVLQYIHPSLMY